MAGTYPRFRLYESDGTTLVYEFLKVVDWGDSPFQDVNTFIEHVSLRGVGGIVSEGSKAPWDLPLDFKLLGDNYTDLVAQMGNLKAIIIFNRKYVLRIDTDELGGNIPLKVKRLNTMSFPVSNSKSKVVTFQDGNIVWRVDDWA